MPNADHKSERRDGASGINYMENPLQHGFEPLGAAPTQASSGSRVTGPSNNGKSLIRPSTSLEDPSNRKALGNGAQNLANSAKRRKTNHEVVSLGGRGSVVTPLSLGSVQSPSTSSQQTGQSINKTKVTTRTVITGESRLQSSYNLSRSSGESIIHEDVPTVNENNGSNVLLQKVLKLIKLALGHHKALSPVDRNLIAGSVRIQRNAFISDLIH